MSDPYQEFVERVAALSNPEHYGNARDLLSQIIGEANDLIESLPPEGDAIWGPPILGHCEGCGFPYYSNVGFCGNCHPERC